MRYVVEYIDTFKNIVVVEAEDEEQAKKIAMEADANFQRYIGASEQTVRKYDSEFREEAKHLDFYWEGYIGLDKDGKIQYYNT